ncbi:hypothetical protein HYFRA_00002189 [Hymenoscyphus fraxineus]|uniref:Uncharacterized protein n=1 Tax=Hymenoscyphus fraxineus TaxID=746836 RepID=A0A9N9KK21_9HELO|nr:hypothetical protein HYFRA_00002189 [Hymenoscyphus fraxineus]
MSSPMEIRSRAEEEMRAAVEKSAQGADDAMRRLINNTQAANRTFREKVDGEMAKWEGHLETQLRDFLIRVTFQVGEQATANAIARSVAPPNPDPAMAEDPMVVDGVGPSGLHRYITENMLEEMKNICLVQLGASQDRIKVMTKSDQARIKRNEEKAWKDLEEMKEQQVQDFDKVIADIFEPASPNTEMAPLNSAANRQEAVNQRVFPEGSAEAALQKAERDYSGRTNSSQASIASPASPVSPASYRVSPASARSTTMAEAQGSSIRVPVHMTPGALPRPREGAAHILSLIQAARQPVGMYNSTAANPSRSNHIFYQYVDRDGQTADADADKVEMEIEKEEFDREAEDALLADSPSKPPKKKRRLE